MTFVCVAQRQIHFTDIDPIAIDFFFFQMRERGAPHSAAVAIGITAGANHKMLRHKAIVEAKSERSTSNVQLEFGESWSLLLRKRLARSASGRSAVDHDRGPSF